VLDRITWTVKAYVKQAFQSLHTVEPSAQSPIFIASTRRSGSTLLMEMIYSQPEVDFVAQPLEFWRPHMYRSRLPIPKGNRYTTVSKEEKKISSFIEDIVTGKIRWRGQYNVFSKDYSPVVTRHVIKDLDSKPILDKIADGMDVVYLVRHPVSCAHSIISRDWGETASVFLEDRAYIESLLDDEQIQFCRSILATGSKFDRCMLEWGLENLKTLREVHDQDWLLLTYEELVTRPEPVSEWLCEQLNLPDPERMAKRVQRPSKTTQSESEQEFVRRGPKRLATRRFQQASARERKAAGEILGTLNIGIYNSESPAPASWALQFGELDLE